jgi:endonuclease YncB( thermonuclease family)
MFLARRSAAFLAVGLIAGLAVGSLIAPVSANRAVAPPPTPAAQTATPQWRGGHPAEVLRVIDGDTFEARVRVWPGMDITTKVRLRGVDAPEMRARCENERLSAIASRNALTRILSEGSVGIARVTQDKYGGRVDAEVSTAATGDVAAALLAGGTVRAYSGNRRTGWCG